MDSRNATKLTRYTAICILSISCCFVSGCSSFVAHAWPPEAKHLPDSEVAIIRGIMEAPSADPDQAALAATYYPSYVAQIISNGLKSYNVDAKFHKPGTQVKPFRFPLRLMPGRNIILVGKRKSVYKGTLKFYNRYAVDLEAGKSYFISILPPHLVEK